MSSCDNFVEQLWRKGKCANCFQSREKHQNPTSTHVAGSATVNYKPIRATTLPRRQRNQNFKSSNAEKANNLFKQEQVNEENGLGNGVNDIKPIAPSCTTFEDTQDRSAVNEAGKTAQDFKPSVADKPKPVPRPRPRPSSRAVEFGCSVKSRDESHQESSADVINGTIPREETLGNSHSGPQCNASPLENAEDPVLSILDHDKESEETNKLNIEAVCEAVAHGKDAIDVQESKNNMERPDVNESDRVSSSNDTVVVNSIQTETDVSPCKNVDGDESDVEEYVPMKSNIVLFGTESLHNKPHETDVLDPNCEINLDLREKASSDNRAINACGSQTEEENFSSVLEFSNPLCVIANDMGDTNKLTTQESSDCDKLNDIHNKITSIKSSSAEPFYVNRPSSSSSESTVSSSHDSGYENTRKSTRSDSSHSASGNGNDVSSHVLKPDEVSLAGKSVASSSRETNHCDINTESSGTSNSSWGSSTWDSCSTSDFHENSSESMLTDKAARKLNAADSKPHSEVLAFHTAQSLATGETPAYVNTTLKPFTKPYRVVDISSGVSVPTMENQNDAPPLPPKEKDLRKDRAEVLNHVYLEPTEETKGIPDQDLPYDKKDVVSVVKVSAVPSLSPKQSSINVTDNSPAMRRAPAPRPRSRVPSQFGTLPKPAPRISRILIDTRVKVDTKEQKIASPPVGKLHDVVCLCRVDF